MNQKIIPKSATRVWVTGAGKPPRKYQSLPKCVRMPGVTVADLRAADVEWGRAYGERPHFEREGCQPEADDPYTAESVRMSLPQLLAILSTSDHSAPVP
jgi:hypothetical protein